MLSNIDLKANVKLEPWVGRKDPCSLMVKAFWESSAWSNQTLHVGFVSEETTPFNFKTEFSFVQLCKKNGFLV